MNIRKQLDLLEAVKDSRRKSTDFDKIKKMMYDVTNIRNNEANHALLLSTTECYLTYLQDRGKLECGFKDNVMV